MTDRELMQQALEALEMAGVMWTETRDAITALRERLAQTEPEPVGEIVQAFADLTAVSIPVMPPVGTKLYTTPPRREWVGLDRKEMFAIIDQEKADLRTGLPMFWRDQVAIIARAIEAKLKEKNS